MEDGALFEACLNLLRVVREQRVFLAALLEAQHPDTFRGQLLARADIRLRDIEHDLGYWQAQQGPVLGEGEETPL